MIGVNGILIQLSYSNNDQEVQYWAVKCLEAISFARDEQTQISYPNKAKYLETCSKIFIQIISNDKPAKFDEIIFCKVCIVFYLLLLINLTVVRFLNKIYFF